MKNNQALVDLIHKLRKEHKSPTARPKLDKSRLADSLVKSVSGGSRKGEFEFFARWTRAAA
tara:strand:- start:16017 stop:16199 length:183 start_codon:yes stop_codon:yes gene_type:complete